MTEFPYFPSESLKLYNYLCFIFSLSLVEQYADFFFHINVGNFFIAPEDDCLINIRAYQPYRPNNDLD